MSVFDTQYLGGAGVFDSQAPTEVVIPAPTTTTTGGVIFDTQYLGGAAIFDSQSFEGGAIAIEAAATTYAMPRKKYHAQPAMSLLSDAPAGKPFIEAVPVALAPVAAPLDLAPHLARIAQFEREAQAALMAQAAADHEYRTLMDAIAAQAVQEAQQQAIQAAQDHYAALMARMDEEDIEMLLLSI